MVNRVYPEDLGADVRPRRRPRIPAGIDVRSLGSGLELAARTVAELAGLALIVLAAWTWAPAIGYAVGGVCLLLAANFAGRSGSRDE